MFASPIQPRMTATLAAVIGCGLLLGLSVDANAASCHVPDRPIFGLSDGDGSEASASASSQADVVRGEPAPVQVDRRCPAEEPEPPSLRVAPPGDPPMLGGSPPIDPDDRRAMIPHSGLAKPIRPTIRIDRPPRAR